jgi:hypothetical protein
VYEEMEARAKEEESSEAIAGLLLASRTSSQVLRLLFFQNIVKSVL